MEQTIRVAVIYYSATGNVYALAKLASERASGTGAHVRLRRVRETAPPDAVASRQEWAATAEATSQVPHASIDDIGWADVVLFGVPTRFGLPASQMGAFLDSTGPLWQRGSLAGRVYGAFATSGTMHGGQESTLLALSHVFHHWGGILVPPGYTAPIMNDSGRPYGAGHVAGSGMPDAKAFETVAHQVLRMIEVATALKRGGWGAH